MKLSESQILEIMKAYRENESKEDIAKRMALSVGRVGGCIAKLRKLGVRLPKMTSAYDRVAEQLKSE